MGGVYLTTERERIAVAGCADRRGVAWRVPMRI